MSEATIDKLSIEISSKAQQAIDSLNGVIAGLSQLGSAVTSAGKGLGKLIDTVNKIDNKTLDAFKKKIEEIDKALSPLAATARDVSQALQLLPPDLQNTVKDMDKASKTANKMNGSLGKVGNVIGKSLLPFLGITFSARFLYDIVEKSNQYQETINLFTASMGEYAEEAGEYASKVADIMGIDPADWMKNQGVFNTLITGFGAAGDKAAFMSKNLTQLGYDISSFYNEDVGTAMQRLQSGMAGELEPLRRLGYDLSRAKLEAAALSYGIDKSFDAMTQAEKAMLRYEAIMNQVTVVQGDMSRTLEAPANQLRILRATAEQAARALGNIFIPVINRILPAAIALLNILRNVANAIASFFGFKMTEIDYTGLSTASSASEEIEDNLSGAAGSAKKMRDYLMGIDELNVINQPSSGGGGGNIEPTASGWDFDLTGYDFIGDAVKNNVEEIQEKLEGLLPVLGVIAGSIGVAFAVKGVANFIKKLGVLRNIIGKGGLTGTLTALKTGAIGFVASFASATALTYGFSQAGHELLGILSSLVVGIGGVGLALSAAMGPVGWIIAAVGTVAGILVGYAAHMKEVAQNIYEASDAHKELAGIISRSEDIISRSSDIMGRVYGNKQGIEDVQNDWEVIRKLVGEVFDLSEKTNKTDEEMALLIEKVDLLDSMGLSNVKEAFDETTGAINITRDAVYDVIDAMQKEALMAAYKDALTQSYKDQIAAAKDYMKATQDNADAFERLNDLEKKQTEMLGRYWKSNGNDGGAWLQFSLELEEAKKAFDITRQAANDSKDALHAVTDEVKYYEGAISDLGSGKTDLSFTKDIDRALELSGYTAEAGANIVSGLTQAVHDNESDFSDALFAMGSNGNEAFMECLGINSPSKVMYDNGVFIMEGVANGITDSSPLLTDSMQTVADSSITVFVDTMTISLANAAVTLGRYAENLVASIGGTSDVMRDMASTAKDMSGKVNAAIASIKPINFKHNAAAAVTEINKQLAKIGENLQVKIQFKLSKQDGTAIQEYASGGFVPSGQLFVAREAGAEMVGNIGNRTAVANNDQIVEAVSAGVYSAMVDALATQQNGGDVYVYIGDKEVYQAAKRGERASGYAISSNPTFA